MRNWPEGSLSLDGRVARGSNCLAALRNFGATQHLRDQRYSEARSWYSVLGHVPAGALAFFQPAYIHSSFSRDEFAIGNLIYSF